MATRTDEKTRKSKRTKKRSKDDKALFGQRAVAAGFVTEEQLAECLKLQKKYAKKGKKVPKLGEIMAHKKYLKKDQVVILLKDPAPEEAPAATKKTTKGKAKAEAEAKAEPDDEAEAEPDDEEQPTKPRSRRRREKPDLLPGTMYAEFMVEEKTTSTPIGDIYLARQDKKERPAHLIIVDPERTGDAAFKKRLLDQMKISAKLEHRHLQKVYMFGKSKGCYYVALEYIRGDRLDDKLRSRKPLEYTHAMDTFWHLIDGIKHLHSAGLMHHNISPSTVMLTAGDAKLTDVGLPTEISWLFEKSQGPIPVYAAPEQLEGGALDDRTDVYSLGAVMYHAMTGTPAIRAKSAEQALERMREEIPSIRKYNNRVPVEAAELVAKMLAPNPDDRYENIGRVRKFVNKLPQEMKTQVAMDYGKILGDKALQAPPPSSTSTPAAGGGTASTRRPATKESTRTAGASGTTRSGSSKSGASGRSKRVKDMDYSELVAQMTSEAKVEEAKDSGRSSKLSSLTELAGAGGRSYRRIDADKSGLALPGWFKGAVAGTLIVGALGSAGFYYWSVAKRKEINEKAQQDRLGKGLGAGSAIVKDDTDEPKGPTKSPEEQQDEECQKLYDEAMALLDGMGRAFKRPDLENAIRVLERCIKRGKPGWRYLGDAYNLMGRCRLYWAYTDHTDEIQTSVKKDYSGTAASNIKEAVRLYKLEGAKTNFKLPVKPWMPESGDAVQYVFGWRSFRAPEAIDYGGDLEKAQKDCEHFGLAAKRMY